MWKIDLSDINDMQSTFDRLYEKEKTMLQKARPLSKIALQKLKVYPSNGLIIPIVLREIR